MISTISTQAEARKSFTGQAELLADQLPALVGGRVFRTRARRRLMDGRGEVVADTALAPRLLELRMLEKAAIATDGLRRISAEEWTAIFERAGERILGALDAEPGSSAGLGRVAERAARTSGLPANRLLRSWRSLAENLQAMASILRVQSPSGGLEAYRTGRTAAPWRWLPAGRCAAVRIPGNFPTINITWLQVLAARRPVLLAAPPEDPFTPLLLAFALLDAGLPEDALSLVHGDAPAFWLHADQVIWPGELPPELAARGAAVRSYHQGRSKVVLLPGELPEAFWSRLARLAVQGCGRLCTNVSSLVVVGDRAEARAAGLELAHALIEHPVLRPDHPGAIVPWFPDRRRAEAVISRLEAARARGAVDLSETVGAGPLAVELEGLLFLRPTVLLVDAADPLFGDELPFPFVTVAAAAEAEVTRLCRGSLIAAVVGGQSGPATRPAKELVTELVTELVLEPTIDKVFTGEFFDHGYRVEDPHEGFLADFLFHKKTILLAGEAPARPRGGE